MPVETVADMKVDDEYIMIKKNTTVRDIARGLLEGENRAALVMDGNRCIGAITLDIIVARTIVEPRHPLGTLAYEIMDTNILKVFRHTRIDDIRKSIQRLKPVAIVVLDERGEQVVGYVSPMDMVEAVQD